MTIRSEKGLFRAQVYDMQQEHTESHCRWSVVNNIRKYNTICKLHISISIDIDISISLHTHTRHSCSQTSHCGHSICRVTISAKNAINIKLTQEHQYK